MQVVEKANLPERNDRLVSYQDSQFPDVSNRIFKVTSTRVGAIGSWIFTVIVYKMKDTNDTNIGLA